MFVEHNNLSLQSFQNPFGTCFTHCPALIEAALMQAGRLLAKPQKCWMLRWYFKLDVFQ